MGTPREDQYDNQLIPAADRINGTVPDRRWPDGTPVSVAMEDRTFSKADGAYQNGFLEQAYSKRDGAYTNGVLQDIAGLIHQVAGAVGVNIEETRQLSGRLIALQGTIEASQTGGLDAEAIAAAVVELLPDDYTDAVLAAIVRRLTPEGATK